MNHFFCCQHIMEAKCGESTTQSYIFPLYLYPEVNKKDLFTHLEPGTRKPNLNPRLVGSLSEVYRKEPTAEEVFCYIYGILYSNVYRSKYAGFLKTDFPKVPFTRDHTLFNTIGKYGSKLVDLHLMKPAEVGNTIAKFEGSGDYRVNKIEYDEEKGQVRINDNQYFVGIEKVIWEYQIGGYRVLSRWLKERRDKTELSLHDIEHFCNVATCLKKTIEVQKEIDDLYPRVEEQTLTIDNLA